MPVVKNREYRQIAVPLEARAAQDKDRLIDSEYYVEGYATTFLDPYVLYEFEDGETYYERVDPNVLDGADVSDVIMQYNHEGRVFARQSNGTLVIKPDAKGIRIGADLSRTELSRSLYEDIREGMITKMSWAFTVAEDSWASDTKTRTILRVKKVYDVSAVSLPANGGTEINARAFACGRREQERQELQKRRARLLKIKAKM